MTPVIDAGIVVLLTLCLTIPVAGGRSGVRAGEQIPESDTVEDASFRQAAASAEIAGYSLSKVQRWLHEVAIARIDPETGLLKMRGVWNYHNTAADCYPFLCWAERLGDGYLEHENFIPVYLRDHGCEIIGGLGLLLAVESQANPAKAQEYASSLRRILDVVLERGTNTDGFMYNRLDGQGDERAGKLIFDIPRHRLYMGFQHDWPRMNTLPEWFTVELDRTYSIRNVDKNTETTFTGKQLHNGLPLKLEPDVETRLIVQCCDSAIRWIRKAGDKKGVGRRFGNDSRPLSPPRAMEISDCLFDGTEVAIA